MSEKTLENCPCCGAEAHLDRDEIFCDICGLKMPFPVYEYGAVDGVEGFPSWEQAREEAIRRWNERKIKELICQITVDGEEILRKAIEEVELDGKTLAEWFELLKGYKQLEQELEATKRERDAAAADAAIEQSCDTCLYGKNHPLTNPCMACGGYHNLWKWRGICPENTEVQKDANAT